jgi:hypothetical protein
LLTPLGCSTIRTVPGMNFYFTKPVSPSRLAQALADGES